MNAEAQRKSDSKAQSVSETIKEEKQNTTKSFLEYQSLQAECSISNTKNNFLNINPLEYNEFCSLNQKFERGLETGENLTNDQQANLNSFTKEDWIKNDSNVGKKNDFEADCSKEKHQDKSFCVHKPKLEIKVESPGNSGNCFKNGNEDREYVTETLEIKKNSLNNLNLQSRENSKDAAKNDNKTTPKNIKSSEQIPGIPSNGSNKAFIGLSKLSSFQSNSLQKNIGSDKNDNQLANQFPQKSDTNQMHLSSFEASLKLKPIPSENQTSMPNQEIFSPESRLKQKNLNLPSSGLNQKANLTLQSTLNPIQNVRQHNLLNQFQNYHNQNLNQNEILLEFKKAPGYEPSLTSPLKNSYNMIPSQKINTIIEAAENSSELIANDFIRKPLPINRLPSMPCGPQPQIKAFPGAELYYKYTSNMLPEVLIMREKEEEKKKTHKCNCKKSRCLKLYCECFANGEYCIGCSCQDCANILQNEKEKLEAFNYVKDKNPVAMKLINKINKESKQINNAPNNLKNINLNVNSTNSNYSFYAENSNSIVNANNNEFILKDKRNSFENDEGANYADINSNSGNFNCNINNNHLSNPDRNFNSTNYLADKNNFNCNPIMNNNGNNYSKNNNFENNNNNMNQAYNSAPNNPNLYANVNLHAKKSPINKNFFEENHLNNIHNLNPSSSSAVNFKQNANNNSNIYISNYNPNLNLTNNSTSQENILINYNTNNNLNYASNNMSNNTMNEQIIGCNCTKSNCTKKYCECFKAGKTCIEACRCRDCDNIDCIQRELKNKRKYKHGNALPGSVYEDFVIEKISIHIEKSNIFIKESVIWDLRDINKKDAKSVSNVNNKNYANNNYNNTNNNNNAFKQEYNDYASSLNREKSDLISLNNNNYICKILQKNEKSGNLSSEIDENFLIINKQNGSSKEYIFNSRIEENNSKIINFNSKNDRNLYAMENKNSFDSESAKTNVHNVLEKSSLLINEINEYEKLNKKNYEEQTELKHFEIENNLKNKTLSKLVDKDSNNGLSNKVINGSENLKNDLIANKNEELIFISSPVIDRSVKEDFKNRAKEINLSDISFENKTPSENENNSKYEYLEEEASSFGELNNSFGENLHCVKKEKESSRIKRKFKNTKLHLENGNNNKTDRSSPANNIRENNNEVEKIILANNYKNFVSKNTFDTVSSIHNSIKNGKTNDDLRIGLLYNHNNLGLGLLNNSNTEDAKNENPNIEVLNKSNLYNVLLEKAATQKDDGLLNKKKARDPSN